MNHRKRLALTQDQLAEKLGVTAQAVSKWENDQSCPDITMLPRLAELFGITTDELLGCAPEAPVHEAEIVTENPCEDDGKEPQGLHFQKGNWEVRWDSSKKNAVTFACFVLMVGVLYFCAKWFAWNAGLWDILWPSALIVWGAFGLFPHFSFFRLGCLIFGGYFLLSKLTPNVLPLGGELLIPAILIIWGLSLLADALRRHRKPGVHVYHNGKKISGKKGNASNAFTTGDDSFSCSGSFCDEHHNITLSRLSYGSADVSFGELNVDLSGVEKVSEECTIDANCSFGELVIHVPRRFRVETSNSTAFASVDFSGEPAPDAQGTIHINANVSFGEISIRYI